MSLALDRIIKKADNNIKKGLLNEAQIILNEVLSKYPKNIRVINFINKINLLKKQNEVVKLPKPSSDKSNNYSFSTHTSASQQGKTSLNEISDEELKNLILLFKEGKVTDVINKLEEYKNINHKTHLVWYLLALSHASLDEHEKAITNFNKALKIKPNDQEILNNLGASYKHIGDKNKALEVFQEALKIKEDDFNSLLNLANAFKDLGNVESSIDYYLKAKEVNPKNSSVFYNVGVLFQDQGYIDYAIENFNRSITLNPNFVQSYINLAECYKTKGEISKSFGVYSKALELEPNNYVLLNNVGLLYQEKNQLDKAIEFFIEAINFSPECFQAYTNLANIYSKKGKIIESINNYNKATQINKNCEPAWAQKFYHQAQICDWDNLYNEKDIISNIGLNNIAVDPFTVLYLEDNPAKHLKRAALFSKNTFIQGKNISLSKVTKKEKIRIGYFSSDFHTHPVMYLLIKALEKHNKDNFEIFAYYFGLSKNDPMKDRVVKAVDKFYHLHDKENKEINELAKKDEIDIAIDLTGYTDNSRTGIFSDRMAPIQVNFLGYTSTMGTNFIDYIIADEVIIPKNLQKYYSEKPLYLPNCYMPTDDTRKISSKKLTRKQFNLPSDGIVFCSFNNSWKISPNEYDIWMRVLNKVDKSVLWLKDTNEYSKNNLRKEAIKRKINPKRIIFAEKIDIEEHLARHKLADIFLDTFNYNGHSSSCDALWSGLPVVTKIGKGFSARVSASLLNTLGLSELITNSELDYEALILKLAQDQNELNKIKVKLKNNLSTSPLFNSELYTKNLEKLYKEIYENFHNSKN